MKIKVDKDERYPIYIITENSISVYGKEVEIDKRTYDKIKKAEELYNETQNILKILYESS